VPGPPPPVVNGLQIDQALDFQKRFQRIQTFAWAVLALVPVVSVLGLFGGGLLSATTAGSDGSGMTATYDRFARFGADTDIDLRFTRATGPTRVTISRDFLDGYQVTHVVPAPLRVATGPDEVVYTFAAEGAGTASMTVQPDTVGSVSGTLAVAGGAPVHVTQFVWP
jgi:hypothetical protein